MFKLGVVAVLGVGAWLGQTSHSLESWDLYGRRSLRHKLAGREAEYREFYRANPDALDELKRLLAMTESDEQRRTNRTSPTLRVMVALFYAVGSFFGSGLLLMFAFGGCMVAGSLSRDLAPLADIQHDETGIFVLWAVCLLVAGLLAKRDIEKPFQTSAAHERSLEKFIKHFIETCPKPTADSVPPTVEPGQPV